MGVCRITSSLKNGRLWRKSGLWTLRGRMRRDVEVHVTCVIPENGVRMGGAIVEQLIDGLSSGFGALGGGKRSKCNKHGGINGTGVI